MHRTTAKFWHHFDQLDSETQQLARKNFQLLKENSYHPSLHFKKVRKYWSVRISAKYRALALERDKDFIWVWIGNHDDYMRLISLN